MKKSLFALALTGALALTAAQADTVLYGSIRLGVTYGYNHDTVPGNGRVAYTGETWNGGYRPLYDDRVIYNGVNWRSVYAPVKQGRRGLDVEDYGSRFGLKGGEELGNGVKVLYQLEWGFDAAEGGNNGGGFKNRLAWIGLQTEFGTFAIGRQENPFANTINKRSEADNFNGVATSATMAAAGDVMFGAMGSLNTFDAKMWSRVGNAVAYVSPTWGGFSFNVAAIMDKGSNSDYTINSTTGNIVWKNDGAGFDKNRGVDIYTINLSYVHESGFYANAGYISADLIKGAKRAYVYGLQIGFDNEQWGVNANFARGENKGSSSFGTGNVRSAAFWSGNGYWDSWGSAYAGDYNGVYTTPSYKHTTTGWDIGGHFSFGPDYASTIRATVGQAKGDKKMSNSSYSIVNGYANTANKETNKLTTWSIGFEQKLSSRTRVWVEYENTQVKQNFSTSGSFGAVNALYAGAISGDYADTAYRSKKFKDDKVSIGIRHDF